MTLCPTRSAAEERSLKRGLLPPHGRLRRDPEGSSRKVDVRRRWDPRGEKTTRTPYLAEMPITTEATPVHPNNAAMIAGPEPPGWSRDLGDSVLSDSRRANSSC